MSVDLPAPLPPTRATTSPGYRSTVTSSTARMPPKETRMSRISTTGMPPRCDGGTVVSTSSVIAAVLASRSAGLDDDGGDDQAGGQGADRDRLAPGAQRR